LCIVPVRKSVPFSDIGYVNKTFSVSHHCGLPTPVGDPFPFHLLAPLHSCGTSTCGVPLNSV
jgi:hypothetical protein